MEGRNVAIEYRWVEDRHERFGELADELSRRGVSVIVANGSPAVAAAKAATATIPIVFFAGVDPVRFGFVDSLARPGGNLTGATDFSFETGPKRLELLSELLGSRRRIAVLLNPRQAAAVESARSLRSAAQAGAYSYEVTRSFRPHVGADQPALSAAHSRAERSYRCFIGQVISVERYCDCIGWTRSR